MRDVKKPELPQKPSRDTATFTPYFWEAYNEIVQPRRFDHYLITRWSQELGPHGFMIVKLLRDRCFHNPDRGILRDTCEMRMEELAAAVGLGRTKLFELFKTNTALQQFVRRIEQFRLEKGNPRRDVNRFHVCMDDPIHPADMEEYDRLRCEKEAERQIPERIVKPDPLKSAERTQGGLPAVVESATRTQESAERTAYKSAERTAITKDLPFGDISKESHTPQSGESPPINPPEGEDADAESISGPKGTCTDATANHAEVVWSSVKARLAKPILLPLKLIDLTETTATLETNDSWARNWLEDHKGDVLTAAFAQVLGVGVAVRFVAGG